MRRKVWIDAGHGGYDSGAIGNNQTEKHNVLTVSLMAKEGLERCGCEVGLTRSDDTFVGLTERCNMANIWGAEVFVSIHNNSEDDPQAHGIETYALTEQYNKLAKDVHSSLLATGLHTRDRGIKYANFAVLRQTKMNACLVELGFISNSEDAQIMKDNYRNHAEAIVRGVCTNLGIEYVPVPEVSPDQVYYIQTGGFGAKEVAQKNLECLKHLSNWYLELVEVTPNDWAIKTGGFTGESKVKAKMLGLQEITNWWMVYCVE